MPEHLAHPLADRRRVVGLQDVVARVADLEDLRGRARRVEERCLQQRRRVRRRRDEVVPVTGAPVEAVDLPGREAALLPPLVAHHLVRVAVHGLDEHLATRLLVPLGLVDVDHHVARRRQRLVPLRRPLDDADAALGHRHGVVDAPTSSGSATCPGGRARGGRRACCSWRPRCTALGRTRCPASASSTCAACRRRYWLRCPRTSSPSGSWTLRVSRGGLFGTTSTRLRKRSRGSSAGSRSSRSDEGVTGRSSSRSSPAARSTTAYLFRGRVRSSYPQRVPTSGKVRV